MRNRIQPPWLRDDVMRSRDAGAWFQQPVVWLGAAILVASIAGCIVTIVLAMRHADTPVETGSGTILKIPLRHSAATPPPAQERR
jgi:sugar phosphate permease